VQASRKRGDDLATSSYDGEGGKVIVELEVTRSENASGTRGGRIYTRAGSRGSIEEGGLHRRKKRGSNGGENRGAGMTPSLLWEKIVRGVKGFESQRKGNL